MRPYLTLQILHLALRHAILTHPALPIAILPYPFCPTLQDPTLYPTAKLAQFAAVTLQASTLYTLTQSTRSPHYPINDATDQSTL
jgi:hypothetical protein